MLSKQEKGIRLSLLRTGCEGIGSGLYAGGIQCRKRASVEARIGGGDPRNQIRGTFGKPSYGGQDLCFLGALPFFSRSGDPRRETSVEVSRHQHIPSSSLKFCVPHAESPLLHVSIANRAILPCVSSPASCRSFMPLQPYSGPTTLSHSRYILGRLPSSPDYTFRLAKESFA
jgi:hypothetical protein